MLDGRNQINLRGTLGIVPKDTSASSPNLTFCSFSKIFPEDGLDFNESLRYVHAMDKILELKSKGYRLGQIVKELSESSLKIPNDAILQIYQKDHLMIC